MDPIRLWKYPLKGTTTMIKKLTSFLEYGVFAEAALVIFAFVFIAVVIRTLATNSNLTQEQASIVLDDQKKD